MTLVTALGECFGTQFPWQLSRYTWRCMFFTLVVLALNTWCKSGYNEPNFTRNYKSHDLWVIADFPRALHIMILQSSKKSNTPSQNIISKIKVDKMIKKKEHTEFEQLINQEEIGHNYDTLKYHHF